MFILCTDLDPEELGEIVDDGQHPHLSRGCCFLLMASSQRCDGVKGFLYHGARRTASKLMVVVEERGNGEI
jgi:hypothetical protein